jgi:sporulation protein YlmC with PRC-barrel domain
MNIRKNNYEKGVAYIVGIFLCLALSSKVLAEDQDSQQQPAGQEQKAEIQNKSPGQTSSQPIYRASELLDKKVQNKEGEDLGKITELVVNKEGQIKYAVLSHGGLLNMGEKMTAVSWNTLDLSPLANGGDHYLLKLNISKEQLSDLPTFNDDNWPSEPQLTEQSTFNTQGTE